MHRVWVLERGVWRADPGRGLLLAARRQPEGTGVRSSATWNACVGNPDCHRSEVPLLSDAQGVGPPLQPLPTHRLLPPQALGRAPAGACSLVPVAAGSPAQPIPTRAPMTPAAATSSSEDCPHHSGHSHNPATITSMSPPCRGGIVCSVAASGTDPCGWPTFRGGAETTAEPQGLCN